VRSTLQQRSAQSAARSKLHLGSNMASSKMPGSGLLMGESWVS